MLPVELFGLGQDLPVGICCQHKSLCLHVVTTADNLLPISSFLAVAEELQFDARHRLAGHRVGYEEICLVVELLLDDDRIVYPDDDLAHVAVRHLRRQQVGTGLLQRSRHGDALVEMHRTRLDVQLPGGDLLADVFLLVLVHQSITDPTHIRLLTIQLARIRLQVVLEIVQQCWHVDRVGLKLDAAAIPKAILHCGAQACRMSHDRLELPPIVANLAYALSSVVIRMLRVLVNAPLPQLGCPFVLAPVFKDLRKCVE